MYIGCLADTKQHHSKNKGIPMKFTQRTLASALLTIGLVINANAEDIKNITRTGESQISLDLSKPIYRTESYESDYIQQVPYTEYEEYYETEYETEREYVCHDRTRYEEECRYEQVCDDNDWGGGNDDDDDSGGSCTTVEECNPDNPSQCKTREVCNRSMSRPQSCSTERFCENVPVRDQDCDFENVTKPRQVLKFREVTKYRSETTCCITQTREVFDHTWEQKIQILFPNSHTLLPNESEKFKFSLIGQETQPQIKLEILQSIYGYKISSQKVINNTLVVELASAPKYTAEKIGKASITLAELVIEGQKSWVQIKDLAVLPRIESTYSVTVKDKANGQIVSEDKFNALVNGSTLPLNAQLVQNQDYVIELAIERSGVVIEKNIQFLVSFEYDYQFVNPIRFTDPQLVSRISVLGSKQQTTLLFVDDSPIHPDVETTYKISISKKANATSEQKIERVFSRNLMSLNAQGVYQLSLLSDFGVKAQTLDQLFKTKAVGFVEIIVERNSPKFKAPIRFKKQMSVQIL